MSNKLDREIPYSHSDEHLHPFSVTSSGNAHFTTAIYVTSEALSPLQASAQTLTENTQFAEQVNALASKLQEKAKIFPRFHSLVSRIESALAGIGQLAAGDIKEDVPVNPSVAYAIRLPSVLDTIKNEVKTDAKLRADVKAIEDAANDAGFIDAVKEFSKANNVTPVNGTVRS